MMKIFLANAPYRREAGDGASVHVDEFVRHTCAAGHEIWMWPGKAHSAARELPASRLRRIARLRQIDVVYVRLEHNVAHACHWAAFPRRQVVGHAVHVWEFNSIPEYGRQRGLSAVEVEKHKRGFQTLGRGCDLAVCGSELLANFVRQELGIRQVVSIPYGADPTLFRPDATPVPRLHRQPDVLNVVWMGSAYSPWHDLEMLARAARRLWASESRSRVALHLLGPGFTAVGDLPPNVHYHGAAKYKDMPSWLAPMDVGVCLYRDGPANYGSPFKLFEYMASGLAVVATEHPQMRQVLTESIRDPLIVRCGDDSALAAALLTLAADPDRVRAEGAKNRQAVIRFYNWDRVVEDTLKHIEKLLLPIGSVPPQPRRESAPTKMEAVRADPSRTVAAPLVAHVVRYDDVSAVSDQRIEAAVADALTTASVPCTWAVVPFACDPADLLDGCRIRLRAFPIAARRHLSAGVASGLFEIALHGYAHLSISALRDQCEFSDRMPTSVQIALIRQGRKLLEDVFGTRVRVFVPPWNRLGTRTMSILADEGMWVSGGAVWPDLHETKPQAPCEAPPVETEQSLRFARRFTVRGSYVGTLMHEYDFVECGYRAAGCSSVSLERFARMLQVWRSINGVVQMTATAAIESGLAVDPARTTRTAVAKRSWTCRRRLRSARGAYFDNVAAGLEPLAAVRHWWGQPWSTPRDWSH